MKSYFISDVLRNKPFHENVTLYCWISNKSVYKDFFYLKVVDSTGEVGVIVKNNSLQEYELANIRELPCESSVKVIGRAKINSAGDLELLAERVEIINTASKPLSPRPRQAFDILSNKYTNYILNNRHLFVRNPKVACILKSRYILKRVFQNWFEENGFIEIDTPLLTQTTLYDDNSTFSVDYFGTTVYLSQCASLYLESAMYAFERVYTITPAFRAEKSRSSRHNPEFFHVKGQIAFCDVEDMMSFIEKMLCEIALEFYKRAIKEIKVLGVEVDSSFLDSSFPRVTYREVEEILNSAGVPMGKDQSLSSKHEAVLKEYFKTPFFVTGLPKSTEPFPYATFDEDYTLTADLIAPGGYGEILGIAQFITDSDELKRRLLEKGKLNSRFEWYQELLTYGAVPHCGFGLGFERLLRWLLKLPHIRDTFAFPRLYNRKPYP